MCLICDNIHQTVLNLSYVICYLNQHPRDEELILWFWKDTRPFILLTLFKTPSRFHLGKGSCAQVQHTVWWEEEIRHLFRIYMLPCVGYGARNFIGFISFKSWNSVTVYCWTLYREVKCYVRGPTWASGRYRIHPSFTAHKPVLFTIVKLSQSETDLATFLHRECSTYLCTLLFGFLKDILRFQWQLDGIMWYNLFINI